MSAATNHERPQPQQSAELQAVPHAPVDLLDKEHIPNGTVVDLTLQILLQDAEDTPLTPARLRERVGKYIPGIEDRDSLMEELEREGTLSPSDQLRLRNAVMASAVKTNYERTTAMQRSPHVRFIESSLTDALNVRMHISRSTAAAARRLEQWYIGADIGNGTKETEGWNRRIVALLLDQSDQN